MRDVNYKNQEAVLDAIKEVRKELNKFKDGGNKLELHETLIRLTSLYTCLDIEQLKTALKIAEQKEAA